MAGLALGNAMGRDEGWIWDHPEGSGRVFPGVLGWLPGGFRDGRLGAVLGWDLEAGAKSLVGGR